MLEAHGLLQLTQRSQNARNEVQLLHRNSNQAAPRDTGDPASPSTATSTTRIGAKSSVTLPAGVFGGSMQGFWQRAADKAAEHAPSSDMMKKLQDSTKSDDQDIAAQKMQQAKAKLQALRLQAQLAAASGNKQQLRRLAQEVAAAARDVASAAHDLAGGIVASVTDTGGTSVPQAATGDGGTAGNTSANASSATGNAGDAAGPAASALPASSAPTTFAPNGPTPSPGGPGADLNQNAKEAGREGSAAMASAGALAKKPIYAQQPPQDGDPIAWAGKALNSLSTDASNAIAQARGLLAFLATAARNKRKSGDRDDDDRFFNDLQRSVDDAEGQVNSDIADARADLAAGQETPADTDLDLGDSATGSGSVLGIDTVTITQVTTTAVFLNITT